MAVKITIEQNGKIMLEQLAPSVYAAYKESENETCVAIAGTSSAADRAKALEALAMAMVKAARDTGATDRDLREYKRFLISIVKDTIKNA